MYAIRVASPPAFAGMLALLAASANTPAPVPEALSAVAEHAAPVLPGPPESTPILRAQLAVKTCDRADAGTDDDVAAQLNDHAVTWLDYARDDFERNRTYLYDLGTEGAGTLAGITTLRIFKTGSDGVCLSRVRLIVNGALIFERSNGAGWWLDDDGADRRTLAFSASALRASTQWQGYTRTVTDYLAAIDHTLTRAELESRIESMVGTFIHGNGLYWGHLYGQGVEVSAKSDSTIDVDLDLAYSANNWWDPEVDVNFDLELCPGGSPQPRVTNVRVDVDSRWYSELLSLGVAEILDRQANSRIADGVRGVLVAVSMPLPRCPSVQTDGDITF